MTEDEKVEELVKNWGIARKDAEEIVKGWTQARMYQNISRKCEGEVR